VHALVTGAADVGAPCAGFSTVTVLQIIFVIQWSNIAT
jgi:hypothetical protein